MKTYICLNCGKEFFPTAQQAKKMIYPYCYKPGCQKVRDREVSKRARARRKLNKNSKTKNFICLNCGSKFELSNQQAKNIIYPYCQKSECQTAKKVAYKKRHKRCISENYNSRLPEDPEYTGKNCIDCGKPVRVIYKHAGGAGVYYRRCADCRAVWNQKNWLNDTSESFGAKSYYNHGR